MLPLLFAFFALGALLCALIGLDHHHPVEPPKFDRRFDRRRPGKNSLRPATTGELRPDAEVESGHTAAGLARGQ